MKQDRFTLKHLTDRGFVEVDGVFRKQNDLDKNCEKRAKSRENVNRNSNIRKKISKNDLFVALIKETFNLEVTPEYQFHPERKWRFDYAIIDKMIAIEVEGGIWTNGRHTRGKGYKNDMEKYTQASILGWRLIRVTPDELLTTNTIDLLKQVI